MNNKQALNQSIYGTLLKIGDNIKQKAHTNTKQLLSLADKIYGFGDNKKHKYLGYYSLQVFISSWLISLMYLVTTLFVLGFKGLGESELWQLVFLFFYYGILLFVILRYKNNKYFLLTFVVVSYAVAGAVILIYGASSHTSSVFVLLPTLGDLEPRALVGLLVVFFLIMPLINGGLDSLSVSVSRYEFAKLKDRGAYTLSRFLKVSLLDFAYAIVFKLLVLFILYLSAYAFSHTGGTFQVEEIQIYFNNLIAFVFSDGKLDTLWNNITNKTITLMISTTMVPTIVHFAYVAFGVTLAIIGIFLRIIRELFTGYAEVIAASISLVIVVTFMWVLLSVVDIG